MFWWDTVDVCNQLKGTKINKLQGIKKGKQTTTLPINAKCFVQSSRDHTNFSLNPATTGSEYEIHIFVSISELDACAVPPCFVHLSIPILLFVILAQASQSLVCHICYWHSCHFSWTRMFEKFSEFAHIFHYLLLVFAFSKIVILSCWNCYKL